MKNFEEFSKETQQAIESFKENFWIKMNQVYHYLSDNHSIEFAFGSCIEYTESFLILNGAKYPEELLEACLYIQSKNFFRN